MTDVAALKALLAKVEAGTRENDGTMFRVFGDNWTVCFDAFHGSLDAAMALHDALLPEWRIEEIHHKYAHEGMGPWYVSLERRSDLAATVAISKDPARAWLISILKALIAEAEA